MKTFHRFFWTFNIVFAAFLAIRSAFLLFFNKTDDVKTWTIILIFCLFYTGVSFFGYQMYVGINLFSKNRNDAKK